MILSVKLNKHLLEVIKPDKLTYRHALLVAMPIELLQVLVQYNALNTYLNIILYDENIVDNLVSRKDKNTRMPKEIRYLELRKWNPEYYLNHFVVGDTVGYLYDRAIIERIYDN